ncbi:MAG: GDP-mannose 4,6-dehydratase [Candidatus Thorarchaeota archaeon]
MGKGKALVTGCAGFIGSHLVDALLERNYFVVGIDNFRTGKKSNISNAIENPNFDFLEMNICGESCQELHSMVDHDVDIIFHLAAISSVKLSTENPTLVNRVNVSGTVNVLDLARVKGTKRVILTSSAAVYGDPEELPVIEDTPLNPLSPYAASKIAAEEYMRAFGKSYEMDTVVLRLFNIYGPRQAYSEYSGVVSVFINRALKGESIIVDGNGKQTRSFVFVDDVVKALIAAAESDDARGQTINISGVDAVTILEVAEKVKEIIGDGSQITHGPHRTGDILHSIGSAERAQTILDFTPSVPFDEGLRETLKWYRDEIS